MERIRCAIYTRKSSEDGLEQEFNSLHAQREACAAYVASQKAEGWVLLPEAHDDGGQSGGTLDRPALQALLVAVDEGRVDRIVVYKIDRLTRALSDFAKIVDQLDGAGASFVSVTQSFNTATSMGRLTLNMLLSFAQFEREVTAERIRDKIAASKRKGLWMGGNVPFGYDAEGRTLKIRDDEAETVRTLYRLYQEHGAIRQVKDAAARLGLRTRERVAPDGRKSGGGSFGRGHIHHILTNPIYAGRIRHGTTIHDGQHPAIIAPDEWDAVQGRLKAQAARPRMGRGSGDAGASASLLAGKLFDETGDRLTPSHTKTRAGKRLRYYVSNRLIRNSGERDLSGWRLPGAQLEQGIAATVASHVTAPAFAAAIVSDAAGDMIQCVAARLAAAEGRTLLSLIERIDIAPGSIAVALDRARMADLLGMSVDRLASDALRLTAPFHSRKRGVETRLIFSASTATVDQRLLRNVANAFDWFERIRAGETYDAIAASAGTSKRRVQQMIDLAFLAPDIVKTIVEGRQAPGLTSDWLLRHALPSDWTEQREVLGAL